MLLPIPSGLSQSHTHLSKPFSLPPLPERDAYPSVDQQAAGFRVVPPHSESPVSPLFSPRDCRTPEDDDPPMTSYDPTVLRELPVEALELQNDDRNPSSLEDEEEELKRCFSGEEEEELEEQDKREEEKEEEEEVYDDDDEEFEETLLEPRTLNEITSLTDRTSPWTSLVSDPDLGSLREMEEMEERPSRDLPLMRSGLKEGMEEEEDRRDRGESSLVEAAPAYPSIKAHRLQDSDSEASDANDTLMETRRTPESLEEVEQDHASLLQQQGDLLSGTEVPSTLRGPGCQDAQGEASVMSASDECPASLNQGPSGDVEDQQREKTYPFFVSYFFFIKMMLVSFSLSTSKNSVKA